MVKDDVTETAWKSGNEENKIKVDFIFVRMTNFLMN